MLPPSGSRGGARPSPLSLARGSRIPALLSFIIVVISKPDLYHTFAECLRAYGVLLWEAGSGPAGSQLPSPHSNPHPTSMAPPLPPEPGDSHHSLPGPTPATHPGKPRPQTQQWRPYQFQGDCVSLLSRGSARGGQCHRLPAPLLPRRGFLHLRLS